MKMPLVFLTTTTILFSALPATVNAQTTRKDKCIDRANAHLAICTGGAAAGALLNPLDGLIDGAKCVAVRVMDHFSCQERPGQTVITSPNGELYQRTGGWEGVSGIPDSYDWVNSDEPADMIFTPEGDIYERR